MGPAHVAFPQPLWNYVLAYTHCLRNFPGYDVRTLRKSSIFVGFNPITQKATPLTTSAINKGINKLWSQVHSSSVSATKIRKSVVTHVRRSVPESRDTLAAHMSHMPGTADRYSCLYLSIFIISPVSSQTMKNKRIYFKFSAITMLQGPKRWPCQCPRSSLPP